MDMFMSPHVQTFFAAAHCLYSMSYLNHLNEPSSPGQNSQVFGICPWPGRYIQLRVMTTRLRGGLHYHHLPIDNHGRTDIRVHILLSDQLWQVNVVPPADLSTSLVGSGGIPSATINNGDGMLGTSRHELSGVSEELHMGWICSSIGFTGSRALCDDPANGTAFMAIPDTHTF